MEPGKNVEFDLLVTEFGEIPPNKVTVELHPCNCALLFVQDLIVGRPHLNPGAVETDGNGIARFTFKTTDPGNVRSKYIDGQVYGYQYCVKDGPCPDQASLCTTEFKSFELIPSLFVFRVFSKSSPVGDVTWFKDIYPIFTQYADLFPVMKNNFFDLGNYHDVVANKDDIIQTLNLPREEPNHMPVTRDLSINKRDMITTWLDHKKPLEGTKYGTLENLHRELQTALEVEHSTIPPYLTALASLKRGYNPEVRTILETIVVQEMLHMTLVANILNAVGGKPQLHFKEFIPHYPSSLPGSLQPDLVVPIKKCSIALIRNIFMRIEQPTFTGELAGHGNEECTSTRKERVMHYSTIGEFYEGVRALLEHMMNGVKQPTKIFTGNTTIQCNDTS